MSGQGCRLRVMLQGTDDLVREIDDLGAAKRCFEGVCRKIVDDYQGNLISTRIFLRPSKLSSGQAERVKRCLYSIRPKYFDSRQTAVVELVTTELSCLVTVEVFPK